MGDAVKGINRPYNESTDAAGIPDHLAMFSNTRFMSPDSPLQFEQRILRPSRYPVLDMSNGDPDGEIATHQMSDSATMINGVHTPIAYPNVIYDQKSRQLKPLNGDDAYDHAVKTGEYRTFDTPEAASVYAQGAYKNHWGEGDAVDQYIEQLAAASDGRLPRNTGVK